MAWRIELDAAAEKDLDNLDTQVAKRILKFLHSRVVSAENPRALGEALHGPRFRGFGNTALAITVSLQDRR